MAQIPNDIREEAKKVAFEAGCIHADCQASCSLAMLNYLDANIKKITWKEPKK